MEERPDLVAEDGWWQFGLVTVGPLFRAAIHLRVEGVDQVPATGPAILAANHVSPLDPIGMALAAARRGRTIRFLTAVEAFDLPVIGWGLRRFRQIPIRRGASDRGAVDDAANVIRSGALAGIFPEGRLGPGDELQPARSGMARLAIASGSPVIPVGVWGMQRRWSREGIRWTERPIRPIGAVVFGAAIQPEEGASDAAAVRALTERVMTEIGALVERAKTVARVRPSQT